MIIKLENLEHVRGAWSGPSPEEVKEDLAIDPDPHHDGSDDHVTCGFS
jgi:hypothetical protein